MRALSISWPKLVGTLLLLQSAGFILLQGDFWWYLLGPDHEPMAAWEFCRPVVALLFPWLSYRVFRGYDWARLSVIALGFCLAAVNVWRISEELVYIADVHSAQSFRWQLVEFGNSLGVGLSQFLAPQAFIVCVLCHRDVAAAFHSAGTERSNK